MIALIILAAAQTVTSGILPNPTLTPGVADPAITQSVIQSAGFSTRKYRGVSVKTKKQVFKEYNLPWNTHANYEVDHFISIEIGGAEDIKNLWPEPLHLNVNGLDEGAKTKDRLEDALGRLVKAGKLSLSDAQKAEQTNWPNAYLKYVGPFPKFKS